MGRRAFTLIELSIVLTIIGLMVAGSFKAMQIMNERSRVSEAKEQVLGAKNAIIGFVIEFPSLPSVPVFDQNLSPLKGNQANQIMYVPANNLLTDDICAFTTTNLSVTVNNVDGSARPPITNIAFVIAHGSANRNIQTALTGNNIVVHSPSEQNIDDNVTFVDRQEQYDDMVEWVTLVQLQQNIGCNDKPFRFITDKLPSAKVFVPYPDINNSVVAGLIVENNISQVTINCNPTLQYGISFNSPNYFSGTPIQSGVALFRCTATEGAPSSRTIIKEFVITIDPVTNLAIGKSCTSDSQCSSGICYNNLCSGGFVGSPCSTTSQCVSGPCVSGACTNGGPSGDSNGSSGGGQSGDPCTSNGQCSSGNCNPQGKCVGN